MSDLEFVRQCVSLLCAPIPQQQQYEQQRAQLPLPVTRSALTALNESLLHTSSSFFTREYHWNCLQNLLTLNSQQSQSSQLQTHELNQASTDHFPEIWPSSDTVSASSLKEYADLLQKVKELEEQNDTAKLLESQSEKILKLCSKINLNELHNSTKFFPKVFGETTSHVSQLATILSRSDDSRTKLFNLIEQTKTDMKLRRNPQDPLPTILEFFNKAQQEENSAKRILQGNYEDEKDHSENQESKHRKKKKRK